VLSRDLQPHRVVQRCGRGGLSYSLRSSGHHDDNTSAELRKLGLLAGFGSSLFGARQLVGGRGPPTVIVGTGTFSRAPPSDAQTDVPAAPIGRENVRSGPPWNLGFDFPRGELGGEVAEPEWVAELDAGVEAIEQLEGVIDSRV
jgi:hypothetical protein